MFDTIKLSIPIVLSEAEITKINWTQTKTSKYGTKSYTTVYKRIYNTTVSGTPNIFLIFKEQNPTESWLKVEVSIPKFLYGSNVFEVNENDIGVFYKKLKKHLAEQLKIDVTRIPNIEKCRVDKLHICKNFNVGSLKHEYLKAMCKVSKSKYSVRIYHAMGSNIIQTVEWKAYSRKIKLYDKEAEVIAKGLANTPAASKAKGMLRFEIELSKKELDKISPSRIATSVLKKSVVDVILQNTLDEIGLGMGIQISSLQQILDTINQQSKLKARGKSTLKAFATDLIMDGETQCRKNYSKATFQRHFKELKMLLGVQKIILSPVTLPPLRIDENKKTVSVIAEQKTVIEKL
ncbi:hypothetical protein LYSIN_03351 [Lysinibacillus sphaericus]|uniref:Replication-associated protein G2P N-terminal domain-containing protein n=1 Tax=Lysinibacillus sphaericus TaxID=1421 RepID=A0A2S5CW69_LYSSH|nr:phage/plasmid replication protein [Lysinibacillus sphaericus]POZ55054.1 hypothetical protein LYSIN_03351 [Lysinibacillus sphaericus]